MSETSSPAVSEELIWRGADRLEIGSHTEPALENLEKVYTAWCQHVPFDSVQKRIHISEGEHGPLPLGTSQSFFENFLAHGTGGTCWPVSEAFQVLLAALGFESYRMAGAMLDFPQIPAPSHGTVVVRLEGQPYLVDPFMLSEVPLPLDPENRTVVEKVPSLRLEAEYEDGRFIVDWRFPAKRDTVFRFGSIPEFDPTTAEVFRERYALTGGTNSAFNQSLYIVTNRGDEIHSIFQGEYTVVSPDDTVRTRTAGKDRDALLRDIFRLSDEIIERLPEDQAGS